MAFNHQVYLSGTWKFISCPKKKHIFLPLPG